MTFLDQNPILRACPTRAPGHSVACTLLPLAVLKLRVVRFAVFVALVVACTLLPLAVLKLSTIGNNVCFISQCCMHPITACGIETKHLSFFLTNLYCCMHPITACGIETCPRTGAVAQYGCRCMHPITACGIETLRTIRRPLRL